MFNKLFFSALLCLLLNITNAQFGVSTEFRSYPVNDFESIVNDNLFDANYGISMDYWFRLKNYRWEMMPTLSASISPDKTTTYLESSDIGLFTGRFQFKNNFYLLDFKNDCNCPTFSKQNGWFKKSFYLQLAPSYGWNRLSLNPTNAEASTANIHLFELGLGAGFDIGFSDLVTLSPYFNYVITNRFSQDKIQSIEDNARNNLNHFVVGVRLGLRPDYARPSNIRRRNLRY